MPNTELTILQELIDIRRRLLVAQDAKLSDIERKVVRWRYKDLTARGRGGRKKIWLDVKGGRDINTLLKVVLLLEIVRQVALVTAPPALQALVGGAQSHVGFGFLPVRPLTAMRLPPDGNAGDGIQAFDDDG